MIEGFEPGAFTHAGRTRRLYRAGTGPGVVVMHEVPGLDPGVIEFARRVEARGFTVAMPDLFGEVGRPVTPGYAMGEMLRSCIRKEFHLLAARGSSPITDWLRALCRSLHAELGEGFEGIEIDSSPGNPHGIGRMAHSVLTEDLVDESGHPTRHALDRTLAFFDARLKSG